MAALTGNNGAAANFRIDGLDIPDTGGNLDPDFNTMNNGEATGYYVNLTSATGWTATNSQLLRGGDSDASPVFKVFGDASVFAVGPQRQHLQARHTHLTHTLRRSQDPLVLLHPGVQ